MKKSLVFLFIVALLGLSAIAVFAQPNPVNFPSDYASFVENDTTYVVNGNYLPAHANIFIMLVPDWKGLEGYVFNPSTKYPGFFSVPIRLEKFQLFYDVGGSPGGNFPIRVWADLGQLMNYRPDGTLPNDQQRYKKLGIYGDGVNFYFTPIDRGWTVPKPAVPTNIHIPDARILADYESFTDGHKTYFRRESFRGTGPFYFMNGKTWKRSTSTLFDSSPYSGFVEFAKIDSGQVVSITSFGPPEQYEWADPGAKGGNWVGQNQLDSAHPYARFGVRIDPSPAGHHYVFVPVRVSDENLLAEWRQGGISSVAKATDSVPTEFALSQNYPNPFNPTTTIPYELLRTSEVQLTMFDAMGRVVKNLVSGQQSAGNHQVIWNGTDQQGQPVPSGVYFYHIIANGLTATKRMMLIK